MPDARYRVLLVASHPVQYAAPVFRLLSQHPQLNLLVAYCSLQAAEPALDREFGVQVAWDIPLLEGYRWIRVPNRSSRMAVDRFWGLVNPDLWRLVRSGDFDAVVSFVGYRNATFWILATAAKTNGVALLFGTDAHELRPREGGAWKARLKKLIWRRLFCLADAVIVPSSGSVRLMRSLGIPEARIVLTPYVVDNDWWTEQAARVDRAAVRRGWGVPESSPVVLFSAKLQPWKRPLDLLRAFAKADVPKAFLVYAGEGPLRNELEAEALELGVSDRVRMLGFVNQSGLPAAYRAADLLILPSEYDAFGVVVNEAMLCGCVVAVSDRVGARLDLVRPGDNGFVFRCGDIEGLAATLREVLPDRARLAKLGAAAGKRMETWSPRENVEALLAAIENAVSAKRGEIAR